MIPTPNDALRASDGADATDAYTTVAIAPVAWANTWVWGTGMRANSGIGNGAESCLVTLGDGVSLSDTESTVAVGSEYTDAYAERSPGAEVVDNPARRLRFRAPQLLLFSRRRENTTVHCPVGT